MGFWSKVEFEIQPTENMCLKRVHSVYERLLHSPRTCYNDTDFLDSVQGVERPDLSKDPDYSGRVEYFTEQENSSLKLSNVEKKDEHHYHFRIITDKERVMGYPGVNLKVTDLHVESPDRVIEGGTALMICKTTCSLNAATFIWYKNGHLLTTNPTINNNKLHLQPVSSEDAGSYSCAVYGYQHLPSPSQNLTVRYTPTNVSVSISPSGEIVEDSSVTLTCSSDGHPPVENYTWFIEGRVSPVGSGHSYSPLQSGSYYCEARNEHGAQRSAPFLFRAKGSVTVYVVVAVVAGIIVVLVLIWMRRRKKQKRNADEGYVNFFASHHISEDDTSNPPDYKNLEEINVNPLDNDGCVPFYEDSVKQCALISL
ncbi:B-cell receptor CD22-like isoform X2 [Hoplias malabaricus]|uniref:B-cell receptor CD22-like isoform X2 n=1 Tax=Hoplias malabaricus TaxID=27720 RepID=UPI0034621445